MFKKLNCWDQRSNNKGNHYNNNNKKYLIFSIIHSKSCNVQQNTIISDTFVYLFCIYYPFKRWCNL